MRAKAAPPARKPVAAAPAAVVAPPSLASSFTNISQTPPPPLVSSGANIPTTIPSPAFSSSSASFSGSIMERKIVERAPVSAPDSALEHKPPASSSFGLSGSGAAPPRSRFAGNNPNGDVVTLQPVGEPVRRSLLRMSWCVRLLTLACYGLVYVLRTATGEARLALQSLARRSVRAERDHSALLIDTVVVLHLSAVTRSKRCVLMARCIILAPT